MKTFSNFFIKISSVALFTIIHLFWTLCIFSTKRSSKVSLSVFPRISFMNRMKILNFSWYKEFSRKINTSGCVGAFKKWPRNFWKVSFKHDKKLYWRIGETFQLLIKTSGLLGSLAPALKLVKTKKKMSKCTWIGEKIFKLFQARFRTAGFDCRWWTEPKYSLSVFLEFNGSFMQQSMGIPNFFNSTTNLTHEDVIIPSSFKLLFFLSKSFWPQSGSVGNFLQFFQTQRKFLLLNRWKLENVHFLKF